MNRINQAELITLYKTNDIAQLWKSAQSLAVINHPKYGKITPNEYRAMYKGKPCPYCGKKMAHGRVFKVFSEQEAIKKGYKYIDKNGNPEINHIGSVFFHPNYVTLDHKLNKARFPEKLFDYDNLEIMCWKCNHEKGDDNSFELTKTFKHLDALADEVLKRYPLL